MNLKTFFIMSLLSAAALATSAAEERQYIFRSIDVDDGLSQNSVMDIIQDRSGFVWFGTKDGLNRYDGVELRRFSPGNAIPGNGFVTVMQEDSSGRIWVGTNAGMCVYYPEYEKEERFLHKTPSGDYIRRCVNAVAVSPSGEIWSAVDGQGFFRYDPAGDVLSLSASDASGSVSYRDARSICFDARGRCYADIGDGNLYVSDDGFLSAVPLFKKPVFKGKRINKLVIVSYSKLFVCTVQGLFCVSLSTGEMTEVDLGWDRFRHVHDIICMPDGDFWVGSDTGIVILDQSMKVKRNMLPEWGDIYSPEDIATYSFCLDREGGLWAGTYFAGAGYYPKDHAHIRRYYPKSYEEHFGQRVREIVPDPDGTLWVGTEDRGLVHFFPDRGDYVPIRHPAISDNIHGLCLDGDCLWIGTYDRSKGLVRYNIRTGEIKPYPSAGMEIYSIERTDDGGILLGTITGLKRYDRDRDVFVRDTSITCFINDIYEDSSGNLWLATNSDGVYMQDALSGEWRQFRYDEADDSALAADMVLGIFEDSRSRIWFTTQGGGVCRYVPAEDGFHRYLQDNEIPFSTVYRIEEDSKGIFWMTTNNGLVRYDEQGGQYKLYTTADGLLSNQFNYSSSCIDQSGKIWVGCIKGLLSFMPSGFTDDAYMPPVVFTGLKIYNRPVPIGSGDSPLRKSISVTDRLDLSASQSTFSISLSPMNFRSPRPIQLSYMLDGYDSEWYQVMDNTISYTRLAPGSYCLKIRGYDSPEPVKELEIRVHPPFYCSVWAFLVYAVAVAAAVSYAVMRFRKKQREDRDRMEQDKIRELYVAKFNFFTNIAHEIRTPLSLISGPVESLKKNMEKTDNPELNEDLDMISQNTRRLTELINQLLDFRKAEQGSIVLNMAECDIPALVKNVWSGFSGAGRHRNIKMFLSLPERPFVAVVDREAVVKILSNLLSNALKYAGTYAGLELSVPEDSGIFRIVLTNDGKIIPPDMRESIFQPFVRYAGQEGTAAGTGIGLALARSLAELHNGSLCMDDDDSVNRFICEIPLAYDTATEYHDSSESGEARAFNPIVPKAPAPGKSTVLVVEDNPEMLAFLSRQLSGKYNVTPVTDGYSAKEKLEDPDCTVDIVTSDVMMPGMDGFELCGWIKDNLHTSHIPVILLTAKADMGSRITGLNYGADAYIEKPFPIAYLMTSVSSILENRERLKRHFAVSPFGKVTDLARSSADEKFLSDLQDFVTGRIDDPDLTVNDMADAVCMSSSSLFRKLKGLIGMAPVEYLQLERLKRAAALLKEHKYTVADVSLMSGFNSNTYFTLCFKKQFGVTPSVFMKNSKHTL